LIYRKKEFKENFFTEAKKAFPSTSAISAMTITSQPTNVVVDLSKQENKTI
jgi:hypothetical protein